MKIDSTRLLFKGCIRCFQGHLRVKGKFLVFRFGSRAYLSCFSELPRFTDGANHVCVVYPLHGCPFFWSRGVRRGLSELTKYARSWRYGNTNPPPISFLFTICSRLLNSRPSPREDRCENAASRTSLKRGTEDRSL